MRSILYKIVTVLIVIGAFLGGWFSALTINQDPFLATMFKLKPPGYTTFIDGIVAAIQENRVPEQKILSEQDNQQTRSENEIPSQSESDYDEKYAVPVTGQIDYDNNDTYNQQIVPVDVTEFITEKMSTSEKAAFLIWLRSRFEMEEIDQLNRLLQQGLTPDNSAELYRNLRNNLQDQDYEYILSIVDRYFITNQNTTNTTDQWAEEDYGLHYR